MASKKLGCDMLMVAEPAYSLELKEDKVCDRGRFETTEKHPLYDIMNLRKTLHPRGFFDFAEVV